MRIHLSKQILHADGPGLVAELLQQSLQCASKLQQVEQANVLCTVTPWLKSARHEVHQNAFKAACLYVAQSWFGPDPHLM